MARLPQLGLDLVTVISTQFLAFSSNSRYLVSYLGKGSVALGSAVEGLNFFFSSQTDSSLAKAVRKSDVRVCCHKIQP